VTVQQRGFMAASWQSGTVEFQRQNIEASMRHDEWQLYAHEHITGSESSPNMVCLKCENSEVAKLKGRAEAYLAGFSKV